MWFTYILLCHDGSYYTGSTNNVAKRFKEHFSGRGAKYTKSHKPIKLIYQEKFATKSEALRREAKIKNLSKAEKQILVRNRLGFGMVT
ncbi:MAG: GIY-YIG nuclease family protein [Candidatus Microgenomates bacterium]|jgi:putative endonuclease